VNVPRHAPGSTDGARTIGHVASPALDVDRVPSPPTLDWMGALSEHYSRARRDGRSAELCVVFDIDGTILDVRHLVVHALLTYDRRHGTGVFHGLVADDITHHEDHVERLLESLDVPRQIRSDVTRHYKAHLWDRETVLAASRPFEGVLSVIRWFQLQPSTVVALNTGRPETMREETLESLNALGSSFRVRFDPALLYMRSAEDPVPEGKRAAIEDLKRRGKRIVAVVDNEPENLRAMAEADLEGTILFLHADTIFESQRSVGARLVTGRSYGLGRLVPERTLTPRVAFVWHGLNDDENLQRFLASDVRWGEIDVRRDPLDRLVLRHDGFDETPWRRDERTLLAETAVRAMSEAGRSIKFDLKEGGETLARVLELVDRTGVAGDRLWFNADLPTLGRAAFVALRERYPRATIACPVDFVMPLLLADRDAADRVLDLLAVSGITRLSLRWTPEVRGVLEDLEVRGWEVNLYGVPDLEAFLEASLLLPTSVTADFNFPEWRYFGRGSGQGRPALATTGSRAP
jgi:phosphoglycolate phosphatase-like HAD superfamily hydrolase